MSKKLWTTTDPSLINPESVYYSSRENALFVSNVVGGESDKDGQGWISKLSPNGDIIQAKWVEGLNAPHGMRSYRGTLWVSDIDQLVAIDLQSGRITERIPIPGSAFLNDVAISEDGQIFVSDTLQNRIYRVNQGQVSVFAKGRATESPNGLLIIGNQLIVAGWGDITNPETFETRVPGTVFRLNLISGRKRQVSNDPLGNLDGVEQTWRGNFIASDYTQGKIFVVSAKNKQSYPLISGLDSPADIALIPGTDVVVVPSLGQNTITAYRYRSPLVTRQRGSAINDRLTGSQDHDALLGLQGNDYLVGRAGSDALSGGADDDRLAGRADNDRLQGGSGDDWLHGGKGTDTLIGGSGQDVFVIRPHQDMDVVQDFEVGTDKIRLGGGLRFDQLTLQQQGQHTLLQVGNQSLVLLQNVQANSLTPQDVL